MLREAKRCYGMALVGLRRSLGRSMHRTRGDAVEVATVKLLGMFEVCTGPMHDEEGRIGVLTRSAHGRHSLEKQTGGRLTLRKTGRDTMPAS